MLQECEVEILTSEMGHHFCISVADDVTRRTYGRRFPLQRFQQSRVSRHVCPALISDEQGKRYCHSVTVCEAWIVKLRFLCKVCLVHINLLRFRWIWTTFARLCLVSCLHIRMQHHDRSFPRRNGTPPTCNTEGGGLGPVWNVKVYNSDFLSWNVFLVAGAALINITFSPQYARIVMISHQSKLDKGRVERQIWQWGVSGDGREHGTAVAPGLICRFSCSSSLHLLTPMWPKPWRPTSARDRTNLQNR